MRSSSAAVCEMACSDWLVSSTSLAIDVPSFEVLAWRPDLSMLVRVTLRLCLSKLTCFLRSLTRISHGLVFWESSCSASKVAEASGKDARVASESNLLSEGRESSLLIEWLESYLFKVGLRAMGTASDRTVLKGTPSERDDALLLTRLKLPTSSAFSWPSSGGGGSPALRSIPGSGVEVSGVVGKKLETLLAGGPAEWAPCIGAALASRKEEDSTADISSTGVSSGCIAPSPPPVRG
mmetsp:Transcript_34810/g.85659  ORF Transcript_34810/g.85659 Transcript_34810/m.85659 type:complete len:237 (-) Transcript_34810:26-736(-)